MKANQWAVEETLPSSDPVCLLPKKVRKLQFSRRPGFLEAVILYAALSSHSFYKGYGDVNCEVEEILQWTRVLALRLTYPLNRVSKPQFPHLWNGKSDSYPKPGSGFLAVVKVLQVKILYTLHFTPLYKGMFSLCVVLWALFNFYQESKAKPSLSSSLQLRELLSSEKHKRLCTTLKAGILFCFVYFHVPSLGTGVNLCIHLVNLLCGYIFFLVWDL